MTVIGTNTQTSPVLAPAAPDWWKAATVYQVYPRSFADANGDGVGDLRGVLGKLDHLQRLGIDVLWLSPVYASPQADAGYDISDYQAIDPLFGSLADLDELIAELHQRGMRLVMDLVVNHTSDEHPWFIESRSSLDNPKRDWYWWRDPVDGAAPNNWESFFSGPTWTLDAQTGQYYLHLFAAQQPDLNWENQQVREAVYKMMRWWLDRGVDGFRMDVINLISKVDGLPSVDSTRSDGLGDGSPHYANGPRLHEFLQEMRREVFDGRGDLITVGEMPGINPAEALLVTDPDRRELNMVFQFEHVGLDHGVHKFDPRPLAPGALADCLSTWQTEIGERGWNSLYLSNHDQPRCASRFGNDREHWRASATALATVMHLQRGTPYVYQGEELGMTNAPLTTLAEFRDVESLNFYAAATAAGADPDTVLAGLRYSGRDNARTPVQWNAAPHAGFTTGTPWIDANPNHTWLNAETQYDDPDSVFNYYRRLIALRHDSDVVVHGTFTRLDAGTPAVFAFTREHDGEALLVLANLADAPATLSAPASFAGAEVVIGNHADATGIEAALCAVAADGSHTLGFTLRPWEALVLRRP